MTTGLDRTIMLIVLFLVSHFNFLFVPCGGLTTKQATRRYPSAFYCTLNTHYRIVSYRIYEAKIVSLIQYVLMQLTSLT